MTPPAIAKTAPKLTIHGLTVLEITDITYKYYKPIIVPDTTAITPHPPTIYLIH